jgi:hypothetical protein
MKVLSFKFRHMSTIKKCQNGQHLQLTLISPKNGKNVYLIQILMKNFDFVFSLDIPPPIQYVIKVIIIMWHCVCQLW